MCRLACACKIRLVYEVEIKRLINEFGGYIVSILSTDEDAPSGYHNVYFRVYEIEKGKLSLLTDAIRKKATLLYLVDFQHNERTIYEIPEENCS